MSNEAVPTAVPRAIRAAAARLRAPLPARPADVAVGELVVATGGGVCELAVIAARYDTHCIVNFAHPYVEYATDCDAILTGTAPYPVVVEFDLAGCVYAHQLVRHVAQLDAATVRAARGVALSRRGTYPVGVGRGVRLAGRADRRWAFKAARGNDFSALTLRCTAELLEQNP